eukprot:1193167-Prorocentrum_minimum.AAC.3
MKSYYPRFLRLIGPPWEHTHASCVPEVYDLISAAQSKVRTGVHAGNQAAVEASHDLASAIQFLEQ